MIYLRMKQPCLAEGGHGDTAPTKGGDLGDRDSAINERYQGFQVIVDTMKDNRCCVIAG